MMPPQCRLAFVLGLALLALTACEKNSGFNPGGSSGDTGNPGTHRLSPDATGLDCSEDDVVGLLERGKIHISPSGTIVPLCSGEVLIADRLANEIQLLDVRSGEVQQTWQVLDQPARVLHDPVARRLVVAYSSATKISVFDLDDDDSRDHDLDQAVMDIALGPDDLIFAATGESWEVEIAVIDAEDGLERTQELEHRGNYLAFDRERDLLYVGEDDSSPSHLSRLSWDRNELILEENIDGGSHGKGLTLSPDGQHLAFPCTGGNGEGYEVYDFAAEDFQQVYGAWDTGPYPYAASFSSDGTRLAASEGNSALLFDVETHGLVDSYEMNWSTCAHTTVTQVELSRYGRILYAYADCGYDDEEGILNWKVLD